jgi:hypothetical protein
MESASNAAVDGINRFCKISHDPCSALLTLAPQGPRSMITAITTFRLPKPITRDEARKIFLSTAPKYQGVPGLVRKVYVISQEGDTVGGIYLWKSRADAAAMYTEGWRAFVRERYGTEPVVTYFDSPVVVDNLSHEILSED